MAALLPRARLFAVLAGFAAAGACANAQSPLAAHGSDGDGGGAGTSGGAGAGGSTVSHAGHAGSGAAGAGQGGAGGMDAPDAPPPDVAPDVFVDPDGPPELRFLHGLADASTVRVCLVPVGDGGMATGPDVAPSADVAYGGSLLITPGADTSAGGFVLAVVGGDLSAIGGASCQQLLASPPMGVRVASLGQLPPTTLSQPRSLLAVAIGCLGGVSLLDPLGVCGAAGVPPKDAGVDAALDADASGDSASDAPGDSASDAPGDAPSDSPSDAPSDAKDAAVPVVDLATSGLLVAEVSRLAPPPGSVGLQVMHASANLGPLNVRVNPSGGQPAYPLVMGLGLGGIGPRPPLLAVPDVAFGTLVEQATLGVGDVSGDLLITNVAEGLTAAGLTTQDVSKGGKGFVVIVIGPQPTGGDAGTGGNHMRTIWLPQPTL